MSTISFSWANKFKDCLDTAVTETRELGQFVNGSALEIYFIAVQKAINVVAKAVNRLDLRQVSMQKVWTNRVCSHLLWHNSAVRKLVLLYYIGNYLEAWYSKLRNCIPPTIFQTFFGRNLFQNQGASDKGDTYAIPRITPTGILMERWLMSEVTLNSVSCYSASN